MFGNIYQLRPVINPRADPYTSAQLLPSRLLDGAPKIQTSLGRSHKHAAIKWSVAQLNENPNIHNLFPQPFENLILFPAFSVCGC